MTLHTLRCTAVSILLCLGGAAQAAEIAATPSMGLAGSHKFSATPSVAGATIRWEVDRITRSETDGKGEAIKAKFYTATGATATFNLAMVSGKQTIWRVRATDNGSTDSQDVQVFPPNKLSSFTFVSAGNPLTRVYLVAPAKLTENSKMLIVMHGAERNANDYCGYWSNWTTGNGTLLICPRFADRDWPDGLGYNRGYVFQDENSTKLNPESDWAYTVVEQMQKYARNGFALKDARFDMWGHSAGGQFIERFLLFKPDAKVRLPMMANPGWYMMPSLTTAYPCGAKNKLLEFTETDMHDFTLLNAVLFRGTKDTDPRAPETGDCMDAQGKGRFARAGYFYSAVKALNPDTTWQLVDVRNVDHDGERMAAATQVWLDEQARKAGQ